MKNRHKLKDLAPRSIVAKEIYKELESGPVYLDISHKDRKFLKKRFPKIYAKLRSYKIDMARDPIPVTPAAHYLCGGVKTDLSGRTKIKNLFAFGEVTRTGVHGANRLASNSLLEALVFSNQIIKKLKPSKKLKIITIDRPRLSPKNSKETKLAKKLHKEIQKLMWKYAGIVRNRKLIKKEGIPALKKIIQELSKITSTNQTIAETSNMANTGLLILKTASKRRRTLGCHFVR